VHILEEVRCPECGRKLMNMSGRAQVKCPKCKALVEVDTEARKIYIKPERQK
jgi:LSD1 subclass zinc finger protein